MGVAGVRPADVGLISMHGTGTPLGDPIETGALGVALADGSGAASQVTLGEDVVALIEYCATYKRIRLTACMIGGQPHRHRALLALIGRNACIVCKIRCVNTSLKRLR